MLPPNLVDTLIAHENGQLTIDQTVEFFQALVDTGLAWHLQGSYGRAAVAMLRAGKIKPADRRPFREPKP